VIRERSIGLLRWFYPGLGVKRWLIVAIFGVLLIVNGLDRYLVSEGMHLHINELVDNVVDDVFPPSYL